jgi:hypothetical protein
MRLKKDARPTEMGLYMAGNYNTHMQRLEIEWVRLTDNGNVIVVEEGTDGYLVSDFDFWSNKIVEEGV